MDISSFSHWRGSGTERKIRLMRIQHIPSLAASVCLSAVAGASAQSEKPAAAESTEAVIMSLYPGLKKLDLGKEAEGVVIYYNPELAREIDKKIDHKGKADEKGELTHAVTTKLSENGASYTVAFDPGPSADPIFCFIDEKTGAGIGTTNGGILVIPGNKFVYTIARANEMHTVRQKFEARGGKLTEVKQPFHYVGEKSRTREEIKIMSGKGKGDVIATIPKGEAVEVLVSDGSFFLLKSRLGLIGWLKLSTEMQAENSLLEGIYFAGD